MNEMATKTFDKWGNEVYCENGRVYLRLKDNARVRCLGIIDNGAFHTQRKLDLHRMRSRNDIGFNWHLIKMGKFTDIFVDLSDGRVLRTTREFILENGEVEHFKNEGFELQIFLKLEMFEEDEIYAETGVSL